jgi:hypothetical protein
MKKSKKVNPTKKLDRLASELGATIKGMTEEQKRQYAGTDNPIGSYLTLDNAKLAAELNAVTDEANDHQIEATFDFKNARYFDRDKHTVNRLVSVALQMSSGIRRLEFLLSQHLPNDKHYGGVGSTGSLRGDLDKLLELTANAAYVVGVLQGAKLEGASPDRLERIKSFATL